MKTETIFKIIEIVGVVKAKEVIEVIESEKPTRDGGLLTPFTGVRNIGGTDSVLCNT